MNRPVFFDIESASNTDVIEGIQQVSECNQFSKLGRHVIASIHGIPNIFRGGRLANLEIYIGISNYQNVRNRFRNHETNKGHAYSAVLAKMKTENAIRFESACAGILRRLHENEALCVANATSRIQGGQITNEPKSCLYLTWSFLNECFDVSRPTPTEVDEISKRTFNGITRVVNKNSIRDVTNYVRQRESTKITGIWHERHR